MSRRSGSSTILGHNGLSRRAMLRHIGLGLVAVPLIGAACGGSSSADDGDGGTADASGVGGADAGSGDPDAAAGNPDASAGNPDAGGTTEWASGGTEAMTDQATYPDPFTDPLSTCAIVAATTEGPCTTTTDLARVDVSEGWTGLPVRLALKAVNGSCTPLVGAVVKIWHTNLAGVYSGQTPNPGMCSGNDQAAIAADFFRGVQTTDSEGVVTFDTCFPGWYNGRAVHIHFQVKSGTTSYRISQLFFPEAVTSDIFANHPEYEGYGQPNTTFANDNVVSGIGLANMARHTFTVARMTDGVMLASKVVTVTS